MIENQNSVWLSTSNESQIRLNHDEKQKRKRKKGLSGCLAYYCPCCSAALLTGLAIGSLLAGVGLATIIGLYLNKTSVNPAPTATVSIITTATITTITATTSTSTTTSTITTSTSTTTTSTTTTTTTTTTAGIFNVNLVTNGDAETGFCEMSNTINSPPGWTVSGPISQVSYNSTFFNDQRPSYLGPNDRGNCYFMGHISQSTSMWQVINLTTQVDPFLIDSQVVKFNLSAWLGGLTIQDDSTEVALTFLNSTDQMIGNYTQLGPVFANNRENTSSLLPIKATGLVPAGARSMTLFVIITRFEGAQNNGDADNIALYLYK